MTNNALWRYLMASSALANCAEAGAASDSSRGQSKSFHGVPWFLPVFQTGWSK
jgi:hypothetical protein